MIRGSSFADVPEFFKEIAHQIRAVTDIELRIKHIVVNGQPFLTETKLNPVECFLHDLHKSPRADPRDRRRVKAAFGLDHGV